MSNVVDIVGRKIKNKSLQCGIGFGAEADIAQYSSGTASLQHWLN